MAESRRDSAPGRRRSVYVPGQLLDEVLDRIPDLNLSGVLQDALRELLGCEHEQLACRDCAAPLHRAAIVELTLTRFYGDMMEALGPLIRRGGTAQGAAAKVREVATEWRVRLAIDAPAPRPTRAERSATKVKPVDPAGDARQRRSSGRARAIRQRQADMG
jgi:hypothetical protein